MSEKIKYLSYVRLFSAMTYKTLETFQGYRRKTSLKSACLQTALFPIFIITTTKPISSFQIWRQSCFKRFCN